MAGCRKSAGSMEVLRPVILLLMVHTCLLFLGHLRELLVETVWDISTVDVSLTVYTGLNE